MRLTISHVLLFLFALLGLDAAAAERNVLFIVDGSQSMWGRIEGQSKIEITRRVLAERIGKLPPGTRAGLIAYGHRRRNDCGDIETLVELKPLDARELAAKINSIRPTGKTPIAAAIERAVASLEGRPGSLSIVLVTDGKDTCNANPCETVKELKQRADFTLHVVGFDIVGEEEALQLQCIADAGSGNYYTAATIDGLDDAFREATETQPAERTLLVRENIQIVMDTSDAMQRPFDDTTRFTAATQALEKVLGLQVADRVNLAFRRFGGPCGEPQNNTELVFGFAQNIAPQIVSVLPELSSSGQTTLVEAANAAIADFNPPDRFADVSKRIVIITGGNDPCYEHAQALSLIRQRLENRRITPEFRFIGIDIPPDRQQDLVDLARATNGEVSIVTTRDELEAALERVLEVEPADTSIRIITAAFDDLVDRLDNAANLITSERYADAQALISEQGDAEQQATLAFDDLAGRKSNANYEELFDAAVELRAIQAEMKETMSTLVALHRAGDREGFNRNAKAYNELRAKHSDATQAVGETIARLRASTGTAD
jgi:hypothetical protein